jgi:hypothetical protein
MRKLFSKLALTAGIMLAMVFSFAITACSMDADKDGDGEFRMSGKKNETLGSYEYELRNRSDYAVTVMVGKYHKKTLTRNSVDIFFDSSEKLTVKYDPADKVKPSSSTSPVNFNNR